ncbi:MAG TPA: tRNA (adenosine(37)-N6)-dimethylallyltransferase MiaA [Burkholderiales bacterium]|nr:tRNA (adenosine(37)-N6)-dimethylallyltransferase MiaA [Burkholderiales bacterium]
MGPTASGKTGVAMALAKKFPVEIVSVDSAQVYRGMEIGTAKPDTDMRREVRHHLIDIIDPTQSYSAAQFHDDALEIMADIVERGRVPLLCGGTMLYFKALREGLSDLPAASDETRLVIDAMAAESGWPAMHRELERIDPATAERLDPNDSQRIQRAMEIFFLTGKPMSELIASSPRREPPFRMHALALVPADRSILHRRIAERFELMLELGLINEVRDLRETYALDAGLPSMRCVGYRQAWHYLDGEYGLSALREKAIAATRQLAKRQLTWLRSMPDVKSFDCLAEDLQEQVETWLAEQVETGARER